MAASDSFLTQSKGTLDKLIAYILEIKASSIFFANSVKIRPHLNRMLDWNNLDYSKKELVKSFYGESGFRDEIVFRALYVIVHASLESFIKEILEDVVRTINKINDSFDDLTEHIKVENIFRTGILLSNVRNLKDHFSVNFYDVSKAIGTCFSGSATFCLTPEAFSYNYGTITPENIEKLFKRVGIEFNWNHFGKSTALKKLFNSTGNRDCMNQTKEMLAKMVKNRNRIAHTGGEAAEVSELDFRQQIEFVPEFASSLVDLVAASFK